MKPPFCIICGEMVDDLDNGLVSFHKTKSDLAWERQAGEEGFTGHPPYCEWFCELHQEAAQKFSTLPIEQAIRKIKAEMV